MPITLKGILEAKGVQLQDTIYGRVGATIHDFPMSIGDFFKLTKEGRGIEEFEPLHRLYCLAEDRKKSQEYRALCGELQRIQARLGEMKDLQIDTDELIAEKLSLRKRKKELNAEKAALEERYFVQSALEIQKEGDFGPLFLEYKNAFYCSNFAEIAAIIPRVEVVDTPKLKEMPLFVRGIRDLVQAVQRDAPLGIVGGPCLFGSHEVTIHIHQEDGQVVQFDFNTGRQYDENQILTDDHIEILINNDSQKITCMELENKKKGVTYQEYLSMEYLFEFARVLGAKIVIPIPDMSYMKFFKSLTEKVADELKKPAFKAFERISHDIADLYLTVIDELRSRYPEVECRVLHSRDPDLCDLFYAKREQYVQKLLRMGQVTANKERTDAVIDYITMLALPFYVFGTRNVLQIDSVDEADSMRKCMKMHSPEVTFHSILFPEYLSKDGVHTVYYAPLEYKDYISFGG
jgi:hypothetical protein